MLHLATFYVLCIFEPILSHLSRWENPFLFESTLSLNPLYDLMTSRKAAMTNRVSGLFCFSSVCQGNGCSTHTHTHCVVFLSLNNGLKVTSSWK